MSTPFEKALLMEPRPIIGIDPGLDGCAVLIDGDHIAFYDTPTLNVGKGKQVRRQHSEQEMADLLRRIGADHPNAIAVLERVHSMPGQGVRSMFTMGQGFGLWLGMLAALEIPCELVTPQRWKAALMDGQGREKDAARLRAMQLFPSVADQLTRKKDSGRADALLMAEWGRRVLG